MATPIAREIPIEDRYGARDRVYRADRARPDESRGEEAPRREVRPGVETPRGSGARRILRSDKAREFVDKSAEPVPFEAGEIRLQKLIAEAGIASRRAAEELITNGAVMVNGEVVTEMGRKVDPSKDSISVHGTTLRGREPLSYVLLNKPRGFITTASDPEGRPKVTDLMPPEGPRLFPVGRLDWDTEGALLMTNDGDLANALLHPSQQVERTYLVKVKGEPPERSLDVLRAGVDLEDGRTGPAIVEKVGWTGKHAWIAITITEGRNREVRRMCERVGHLVLKLRRVEFAGITIDGVRPGETRQLTTAEVSRLRMAAKTAADEAFDAAAEKVAAANAAHDAKEKAIARAAEKAAAATAPGLVETVAHAEEGRVIEAATDAESRLPSEIPDTAPVNDASPSEKG